MFLGGSHAPGVRDGSPVQPIENATGSDCLTTEDYAAQLPPSVPRAVIKILPVGLLKPPVLKANPAQFSARPRQKAVRSVSVHLRHEILEPNDATSMPWAPRAVPR